MRLDQILLALMAVIAVANLALSIITIRRSRGLRLLFAAMPLVLLLAVAANILLGVTRDPTSHNLWPFELLLASLLGIVYSLGFLAWISHSSNSHHSPTPP